MEKTYNAIILGAGLAGLSCADKLLMKSKTKMKVAVLEKNSYLGGLAATFRRDGFLFDLAPHRWFTKNGELNKWINDLMGKELIWVNKYTPIYQYNKFFNYPIEVLDVLKKVGVFKAFIMLSSYFWTRVSNEIFKKKIITMKDAYINRFGYVLYKWFNEEYNDKIWGKCSCENMSADWVEQRVKNLSMITAIKNALGVENKVISLTPYFKFPKLGIGRIAYNLSQRINKNNGKILKNILIKKIREDKFGYRLITNVGIFKSKHLVSSIPIDELVRLFSSRLPSSAVEAAGKLSYINQRIVVLLAKRPQLTPFTWIYVHPPKIKFFRFLETNNWSQLMSPKGKTSVVFEYPYQSGDKIEKIDDARLIELTISDFIKYFSPQTKKSDFIKRYVFNVNKAYPKYNLNYRKLVNRIKQSIKKNFKNLQLIGRNGMFRYNNMDHSVFTGILAARNILEEKFLYNLENVNNEAEYLEEKSS